MKWTQSGHFYYYSDDHDNHLIVLVAGISAYRIVTSESKLGFLFDQSFVLPYVGIEQCKVYIDHMVSNWVYNNFLKEEDYENRRD